MSKTIYSEDHQRIVKKIRSTRIESGLDQKQVAKLLGKTQSFVSKVESGQRKIDIVLLKEIAQIYKKPVDYFLKN